MGQEEDMGEDPRNVKGILKISTRRATIQQERAITIGFNSQLITLGKNMRPGFKKLYLVKKKFLTLSPLKLWYFDVRFYVTVFLSPLHPC